jgi:hypothetical protein
VFVIFMSVNCKTFFAVKRSLLHGLILHHLLNLKRSFAEMNRRRCGPLHQTFELKNLKYVVLFINNIYIHNQTCIDDQL